MSDNRPLFCDALTAYRTDLERVGDVVRFGAHDDAWLRLAVRVERMADVRSAADTRGGVSKARPLCRPASLLAATQQMEAAGALLLAFTTLEAARRCWGPSSPGDALRAVLRQARICRTLGRWDVAERYYAVVIRSARRAGVPALAGEALLGSGSLYYHLGELGVSRSRFVRARSSARPSATTVAASYHGEMAVALAQGDLSQAIHCGIAALQSGALRPHDGVGVLVNIAAIAIRTGHGVAAQAVLTKALRQARHGRLRMHVYGKAALAAASVHDTSGVERAVAGLRREASRVNCPADELEARSEAAQAYNLLGQRAKALRFAQYVRTRALSHGMTGVVARCDAILAAQVYVPPLLRLRPQARRQLLAMEFA